MIFCILTAIPANGAFDMTFESLHTLLETEEGDIAASAAAHLLMTSDRDASGGYALKTDGAAVSASDIPAETPLSYTVTTEKNVSYYVWVRLKMPASSSF